jgi:hypothetical protein
MYPADTMKSLVQADYSASGSQVVKVTGIRAELDMVKQVMATNPKSLFRGIGTCITRAFIVNSCAFFVYEQCNEHLTRFLLHI